MNSRSKPVSDVDESGGRDSPPLRWDRLLKFIPIFERQGSSLGRWAGGGTQMPWFDYSPEGSRFMHILYEDGWIVPFDWIHWKLGKVLSDHPHMLARARTTTLRRLLTTHVRLDRFSEGHLARMLDEGHILAILRRLAELQPASGS